ncbi:MAG: DUF4783 domain-containing protein [Bacteroidota bacterium]
MKKVKNLIFILCILGTGITAKAAPAFDIPVKIFKAIELGNVENLSDYFNESVELILMDEEGIYSKAQATQILKDFFNKNRPESFSVLHQGGSEKVKYAIGTLETKSGKYRINFLVKMRDKEPLIHQLRIQEE